MKLTFENVYKEKKEFKNACKNAGACKTEYKKLVSAKNKKDFMDVIYNNFCWINRAIENFEPKFDGSRNFKEGFAMVRIGEKYGFIKPDGSWLVEPKFIDAYDFVYESALVQLNDKWGFISTDGSWLIEPKFDDANYFQEEGVAWVKIKNNQFWVDTKGNLTEMF